jgi:SAM-dependent methyltransferase
VEPHYYETYYQHETRHWWFRWRYDLVERVIADLPATPGRPLMLDAGCGTGQMLRHLQQFGDAIGFDVSAGALAFARSRGAADLVLGTVAQPPFPPESFDRIFILDVIEHVDDDLGMLSGLHALLKPGGHLVATVPAYPSLWSDHDRINRHCRRYLAPQVDRLLQEAGFEIGRVAYCNSLLFPIVYPLRRVMALLQRRQNNEGQDLESDLHEHSAVLNEALFRLLRLENRLTRRWNPPFGVSILAIARKPAVDSAAAAVSGDVARAAAGVAD